MSEKKLFRLTDSMRRTPAVSDDELARQKREFFRKGGKVQVLPEWFMTERDTLELCADKSRVRYAK